VFGPVTPMMVSSVKPWITCAVPKSTAVATARIQSVCASFMTRILLVVSPELPVRFEAQGKCHSKMCRALAVIWLCGSSTKLLSGLEGDNQYVLGKRKQSGKQNASSTTVLNSSKPRQDPNVRSGYRYPNGAAAAEKFFEVLLALELDGDALLIG
jgi:hypothetical protein